MIVSCFTMNCLRKSSVVLCVFVLLLTACKDQEKKAEKTPEAATATSTTPFINPPIKSADVPYEVYEVDAVKGDTLIYSTGSIILFPPNAFVDEAGKPVTGKVQVKYREFKDPIDFFLAGIPMNYDSAGTSYQFESSGMLDIRAFKDGKPVFVNKDSKPEINLASTNKSDKHSLYFLDTVQGKWINKGGMQIIESRKTKATDKTQKASVAIAQEILPEPVKPLKADNKSSVLKIEVDPSSFREFAIYKNLKFQVDESKTPFNKKDSEEEWNNLELLKGSQPGTYLAKFSNAGKSVTYAVKPVFTGSDYDNALKVFENEYAVYKKQTVVRTANEIAVREKYTKDSIQYVQEMAKSTNIERLNAIIAQKNREIEKQNEIIAKKNKEIAKQNIETAKRNLVIEKINAENTKRKLAMEQENEKRRLDNEKQNEIYRKEGRKLYASLSALDDVYRSFAIESFGFWNCDVAFRLNATFIRATYKDEKGNVVQLSNVKVIVKGQNSVFGTNNSELSVMPGSDHMILGICNNQIAYVSYSEFKKLKITADTKEQTFVVKIVGETNLNYEYVIGLLKN